MSGGGEKAAPTSGSQMTLQLSHPEQAMLLRSSVCPCVTWGRRSVWVLSPWSFVRQVCVALGCFPMHLQECGITQCVLLHFTQGLPHDLSVSHAGSKPGGLCLKGVLLNRVFRVKDEASLAPERVFLWPHKSVPSGAAQAGVVITVTAPSCHLMMKSAWHFVVGFPLSFVLKTPDLFFKNKNPPWVSSSPEMTSPSFGVLFLLSVQCSPDSLHLHAGVPLHQICSNALQLFPYCKIRQFDEKGTFR